MREPQLSAVRKEPREYSGPAATAEHRKVLVAGNRGAAVAGTFVVRMESAVLDLAEAYERNYIGSRVSSSRPDNTGGAA